MRLVPTGTDGGRMADSRIPSFLHASAVAIASFSSPTATGMMGVSPAAMPTPVSVRRFRI